MGEAQDAAGDRPLSEQESAARLDELRQRLAATPPEAIVANHCYGLFELAAVHLSCQPPQLDQARLAIDALGCLLEGLEGRLGPDERNLRDGRAQLQLAFVQMGAAPEGAVTEAETTEAETTEAETTEAETTEAGSAPGA